MTENGKKDLNINCKKTECLVVTKQKNVSNCTIKTHGDILKQVDGFS